MAEKQAPETYSEEEAAKRRDEALRRALKMPPLPEKGRDQTKSSRKKR